jgi:Ca2+-binding EF-hand superfamily protein
MFQLFNRYSGGSVSFRQFLLATNMTSCGSAELKLRWAFRLFDADDSGNIDTEEMFEIVATFYDMEGEQREPALDMAEEIFKALDVNGDGWLDEDEFVK